MWQLNIAERLMTMNNFQDSLKKAIDFWEEIKEGRESETKKYFRSIMTEALKK
jgi:hypothetical protein